MKYYLIAGEASGDLHGSNLMAALKKTDPQAEFRFWGGDRMATEAGHAPVKHISELAFMGFVEVLMNLPTILNNMSLCKKDISNFQPHVLVLIDYPGFNLRIAEWAKKKAYKVAYYIAPQVWAWKTNRVQKLKLYVDRLLCILPFEVDFFARHGLSVDYVGHPLLDAVKKLEKESAARDDESPIALIPGSRKQEIKKMLPTMLKTAKKFKYEKFVVTAAPAIEAAFYQSFDLPKNVALEVGKTHKIMRKAKAALVTSGTATLETALFNTPEVVCYKANALSVAIARRLIKVKYISLVNLIMDKPVVTELIQQDFNADKCADELNLILKQGPRQLQMLSEYRQLKEKLGNAGASNRAASLIFELAQL